MAGLPLWLLSYSWLPFAMTGREEKFVIYLVILGEAGAFLAGIAGIGLGMMARREVVPGSTEFQRASRSITLGASVLMLILVPNLLGAWFF